MLSLSKLKQKIEAPVIIDDLDDTMPILTAINDEEELFPEEELSSEEEYVPAIDWYIPKKSFRQILDERSGGTVTGEWTEEINELEAKLIDLPKQVKLNDHTTITDVKVFVETHLKIVKNYNGNKTYQPYLDRLVELRKVI